MFFASTSHFLKNDWTPIIVSELCIFDQYFLYLCVWFVFKTLFSSIHCVSYFFYFVPHSSTIIMYYLYVHLFMCINRHTYVYSCPLLKLLYNSVFSLLLLLLAPVPMLTIVVFYDFLIFTFPFFIYILLLAHTQPLSNSMFNVCLKTITIVCLFLIKQIIFVAYIVNCRSPCSFFRKKMTLNTSIFANNFNFIWIFLFSHLSSP